MSYALEELSPDAHSLVYSSYIQSAWELCAPDARVTKDEFCAVYHARMQRLLASSPIALVVSDPATPAWVGGWILAHRREPDALAVHWLYVKHAFRRRGFASALLAGALERAGDPERVVSTFKIPRYRWGTDRRTGRRERTPFFVAAKADALGVRFEAYERREQT